MVDMAFREGTRIYITGSREGLNEVTEALERHLEIELAGRSATVREGAKAPPHGHLQAVLHATRSSELPEDDLAAIREYTRAPVVLLASGEASLLDAALEADVADVLCFRSSPRTSSSPFGRRASPRARPQLLR